MIFIIGLTASTGTNYLQRLLCLDRSCVPFIVPEDFLLKPAGKLIEYGTMLDQSYRALNAHWVFEDTRLDYMKEILPRCLGDGLQEFVQRSCGKMNRNSRIVLKTPDNSEVSLFPRLFPDLPLVLLVRDGRSVTQALVRKGEWKFEDAAQAWAWAVDRQRSFEEVYGGSDFRYRVVRYEKLYGEPRRELRSLLKFLDLDAAKYPFHKAENLTVTGSSFFAPAEKRWVPKEKTREFRPLETWKDWTPKQHRTFSRIAGKQMRYLGYGLR